MSPRSSSIPHLGMTGKVEPKEGNRDSNKWFGEEGRKKHSAGTE